MNDERIITVRPEGPAWRDRGDLLPDHLKPEEQRMDEAERAERDARAQAEGDFLKG